MRQILRRLWHLFLGITRTSRTVTWTHDGHTDHLKVDWASHEWTCEDGHMEREVWDRTTGAITNYSSVDGGKTWALIP